MGLIGKARTVWRGLTRPGPDRYFLAELLAYRLDHEAVLSERDRMWLSDRDFSDRYRRFDPDSLRRMDRIYLLDQLARLAATLPGDTVECGAYAGASSYFICRRIAGSGKLHHIFDSFAGLSPPGPQDGDYWRQGDLASPEETARTNLAEFDFVRFYKGWIPDRFVEVADRSFSLVHLDVDLYRPTRDCLEFFYPRMVEGGVLIMDDYGFSTCPGARRAALEFFSTGGEVVLDMPTGQGVVFRR